MLVLESFKIYLHATPQGTYWLDRRWTALGFSWPLFREGWERRDTKDEGSKRLKCCINNKLRYNWTFPVLVPAWLSGRGDTRKCRLSLCLQGRRKCLVLFLGVGKVNKTVQVRDGVSHCQ
jgi:hypothetical protein